jgi:hypothetical protein
MKNKIVWLGLWVLASLLTACNTQPGSAGESAAQVNAWFDAPLPGSIFYPPNPCQFIAHGASPNGITAFELSVNGVVAAEIPSPEDQATLVTLVQSCGVNAPGDYLLQIRARDSIGTWSSSAQTNMTIAAEEELVEVNLEPTQVEPQQTATPSESAFVTLESVSTNTVYIGADSCGTREVTIKARAFDPQGLKVLVLFYRLQAAGSNAWLSVAMNPASEDLYQRTLNLSALFGSSLPFDQSVLQYQVVLQNMAGDTSTRTAVFSDITVLACGGSSSMNCSAFIDPRSCAANGCLWNLVPGSTPSAYTCESP